MGLSLEHSGILKSFDFGASALYRLELVSDMFESVVSGVRFVGIRYGFAPCPMTPQIGSSDAFFL